MHVASTLKLSQTRWFFLTETIIEKPPEYEYKIFQKLSWMPSKSCSALNLATSGRRLKRRSFQILYKRIKEQSFDIPVVLNNDDYQQVDPCALLLFRSYGSASVSRCNHLLMYDNTFFLTFQIWLYYFM